MAHIKHINVVRGSSDKNWAAEHQLLALIGVSGFARLSLVHRCSDLHGVWPPLKWESVLKQHQTPPEESVLLFLRGTGWTLSIPEVQVTPSSAQQCVILFHLCYIFMFYESSVIVIMYYLHSCCLVCTAPWSTGEVLWSLINKVCTVQ